MKNKDKKRHKIVAEIALTRELISGLRMRLAALSTELRGMKCVKSRARYEWVVRRIANGESFADLARESGVSSGAIASRFRWQMRASGIWRAVNAIGGYPVNTRDYMSKHGGRVIEILDERAK